MGDETRANIESDQESARALDAETAPLRASRPPRDNLVRALFPGGELRLAEESDGLGTLTGHFAVFDQWTEIDSIFEGRFLERVAPGSFRKSFGEGRSRMRVLFQHGADPMIGDKPLGPIEELREDETGAYYEVPLLDTSYNRDLLPGLRAGVYGASFRFRVTKEDFAQSPKASAWNPRAIPERTIREAEVMEFGPVTFPAYSGATAGIRSMTDAYMVGRDPVRITSLLEALKGTRPALPDDGAEPAHSDAGSRATAPVYARSFRNRDEWLRFLTSRR